MAKFLLALILVAMTCTAQAETGAPDEQVTYLFVQNAKRAVYDGITLTLEGVTRSTIFFSDRPERIAGHMATQEFLKLWDEGEDNFSVNPPNATLSILKGEKVKSVVVVLRNPRLLGTNLSYDVEILLGDRPKTFPATGDSISLFIDTIGNPLAPTSIAGRHRRMERREDERREDVRKHERREEGREREQREDVHQQKQERHEDVHEQKQERHQQRGQQRHR